MHIQGRQVRSNPVNPYSAAAEWAIADEQIANGGKKLVKSARSFEDASSSGETSLLANWMDCLYNPPLTIVEYQTPAMGNDSNFG
jgi:hypothetical protein